MTTVSKHTPRAATQRSTGLRTILKHFFAADADDADLRTRRGFASTNTWGFFTVLRDNGLDMGSHVLDLIVEEKVVVELKAISGIAEVHKAIALSYLAATKLTVALLINFGESSLAFKRVVRQHRMA